MKKIFLAFIAAITLFTACEDKYNDQFEGMEDKVWKAYTPTLEYTLTATDYTTISTAITNNANATAEEKALAATVKSKQAIPDLIKLSDYAPAILAKLYKTFDLGGACVVKYNRYAEPIVNTSSPLTISAANYTSMGQSSSYFNSQAKAELLIKNFLDNTNYADPNTQKTVKYVLEKQSIERYIQVNADKTTQEVAYDKDAYKLVEADYDLVGRGQHDNFNDLADALALMDDLATARTDALPKIYKVLVYKNYYDTYIVYTFDGKAWSLTSSLQPKSEQYIFNDQNVWVFDPSIKFTASKTDLAIIVEWVKTNKGTNFLDSYGTAEFYSGASAYRGNVDYTILKREQYDAANFLVDHDNDVNTPLVSITADAAKALMDTRIKETMAELLKIKYPNADPNRGNYQLVYKCTGPGTFTYVSGPTKL